jgi:hypothetical protein
MGQAGWLLAVQLAMLVIVLSVYLPAKLRTRRHADPAETAEERQDNA